MMYQLIKFDLKRCMKQKRSILIFIVLPICFYLISTYYASSLSISAYRQFNRNYLIQMAILNVISYIIITLPQELAQERQVGWIRRLVNTKVSYYDYFMSKIGKTSVLSAFGLICLCFTGILNGVQLSFWQWLHVMLIILISSLSLYPFAYGLSMINTLPRVTAYCNGVYFILIILGGLWIPLENLPHIIQIASQGLPIVHIKNVVIFYLNTGQILWLSVVKILIYCIILLIIIRLFIRKVGDLN